MINFKISETDEYDKLVPFLIEQELEFTEEDLWEVPTDLVKCWEITEGTGTIPDDGQSDELIGEYGRIIGAFVLARRDGEFICDGIAVDPEYRGMKLGKALLDLAVEEVLRLGGNKMYLVARAPGFFRKYGFKTILAEGAPNFFECKSCPQYGVSCSPEVMVLEM